MSPPSLSLLISLEICQTHLWPELMFCRPDANSFGGESEYEGQRRYRNQTWNSTGSALNQAGPGFELKNFILNIENKSQMKLLCWIC